MTRLRRLAGSVSSGALAAIVSSAAACVAGVVLLALDASHAVPSPSWVDELGLALLLCGLLVLLLLGLLPDRAVALRRRQASDLERPAAAGRLVVPPPRASRAPGGSQPDSHVREAGRMR